MKKLLFLFVACVMVFTVTATAANGGFVSSPSTNLAPELVDARVDSEDCLATVILTAYIDRHELSAEDRAALEDAYATIAANADLTKLTKDLIAKAEALGIATTALSVSDLFDISLINCEPDVHAEHGSFHITLKAETAKNFVALLHYMNGEWSVVDDATVDGTELSFSVDSFSPFAIVVNTYGESEPPVTGDAYLIGACAAVMAVSAVAFAVAYKKSRKTEEN